jgi:hypothetical protein
VPDIRAQWNAVVGAPLPHLLAAAVVTTAIWAAMEWRYGGKIERLEQALEVQKLQAAGPNSAASDALSAPPFPTAQLAGVLEHAGGIPVTAGVPIAINLGAKNLGPGVARNVKFAAQLAIGESPLSPQVTAAIDATFRHLEVDLQDDAPQDMAADAKVWSTLKWTGSEEEVQMILNRTLFVYAHLRYQWEDSSGVHYGEVCRYLNSPNLVGPKNDEAQFAYCESHNKIQ